MIDNYLVDILNINTVAIARAIVNSRIKLDY